MCFKGLGQSYAALESITYRDGLPNNDITHIIQDRVGFMWLGSYGGLIRHDGYSYRVYANDPADSTSLGDNSVRAITEDKNENILWVGTQGGGLNKLNQTTLKDCAIGYNICSVIKRKSFRIRL